jgi:hypothetical protein
MTSTEFVAFATSVSHHTHSWDDASEAFPGRARWEAPSELEATSSSEPTTTTQALNPNQI